MTYEEIIKGIISKLSGDNEKDVKFLEKEALKYKNHEYAREILKAIYRLVFERLPDNVKDLFRREDSNFAQYRDIILNEAEAKMHEGKLNEAERLLKILLPYNETRYTDKVSDYFSFNNRLEWTYYHVKFNPSKEIRQHPTASHKVYHLYGYIFFEKKDYIKALEMLSRGLQLNPLDTNLLFEKAEIFKIKKDWSTFKKLTDECIEYAYTPSQLARAYRNYGYMLIEQKDYDGATACYLNSLNWEDSVSAKSELYHISKKTNKVIDEKYYQSNLLTILKDRQIPLANKELLSIIYSIAEKMFQDDNHSEALYYYKLLYNLVGDEDIYVKIQGIEGNIKGTA
jgi:tetratricopeptide (TPR) repeat protein